MNAPTANTAKRSLAGLCHAAGLGIWGRGMCDRGMCGQGVSGFALSWAGVPGLGMTSPDAIGATNTAISTPIS